MHSVQIERKEKNRTGIKSQDSSGGEKDQVRRGKQLTVNCWKGDNQLKRSGENTLEGKKNKYSSRK